MMESLSGRSFGIVDVCCTSMVSTTNDAQTLTLMQVSRSARRTGPYAKAKVETRLGDKGSSFQGQGEGVGSKNASGTTREIQWKYANDLRVHSMQFLLHTNDAQPPKIGSSAGASR